MTKLEEFLAGLSFFLVAIGGFLLLDVNQHFGDYIYLLKRLTIMTSGHFLFAMVKIKMILRAKL